MSYIDVPPDKAHRLINTGPTVFVTSCSGEKINIMTAAWHMPVSFSPPLLAVGIGNTRYTHELITESGEFTVVIPPLSMVNALWYCGIHSGKDLDKFSVCGLTVHETKKIKAPAVEGCIGFIECRLHANHRAGDHTIFVGRIVCASAKEGLFYEMLDVQRAQPVHHLGDKWFCTTNIVEEVK